MRHGRAVIPFKGKDKGMQVCELDNGELSSLRQYVVNINADHKWQWLLDSIHSEMQHRGFNVEPIEPEELPPPLRLRCVSCHELFYTTRHQPYCEKPACRNGISSSQPDATVNVRFPPMPRNPVRAITVEKS